MSSSTRPTALRLYNPCVLVASGLTSFSRWWLGIDQQQTADYKTRLSCRVRCCSSGNAQRAVPSERAYLCVLATAVSDFDLINGTHTLISYIVSSGAFVRQHASYLLPQLVNG
jgi:hypothetical protein